MAAPAPAEGPQFTIMAMLPSFELTCRCGRRFLAWAREKPRDPLCSICMGFPAEEFIAAGQPIDIFKRRT